MKPGDIIAEKYRLERILGSGGFGDVWVATQLGLNREVALKTLTSFGDSLTQRFEREAQALVRLDHPHCVQLFDFGNADGRRYLVMPVVDGAPLDAWLSGAPPVDQRLRVARQICSALCAAHAQGIVHRDLKPANVMIAPTPDGPHAIVLDFGIAKLANAPELDITKTGEVFGTPGYMSPEQLRASGDVGPATDLYALGVILYEMFEGRPPFLGESMLELAMQHMQAAPPPMTAGQVPAHIQTLITQLLAKSPGARPPSAEVVLREIAEQTEGDRPRPVRPQSVPMARAAVGNRNLALALAAVIALVAAGTILWTLRQPDPPERKPETQSSGLATPLFKQDEPRAVAALEDVGLPPMCSKPTPRRSDFEFSFRVPEGYGGDRLWGLLVIVHDWGQHSTDIVRNDRLAQLVDERGYVVIAPHDDVPNVWTQREDDASVRDAIAASLETFCIDPARVFLLGIGNGGDPVYEIARDRGGITAIVTSGYRLNEGEGGKRGKYTLPYLFTNPTDDKMAPRSGGKPCIPGNTPKMSLREHEQILLEQWGCKGSAARNEEDCTTLTTCSAPLEICRRKGGRLWPEFTPIETLRLGKMLCGMRPATHDFLAQAFEFFDRFDPARSDPEDATSDVEGVPHPAAP